MRFAAVGYPVDVRKGELELPLLSVSQYDGVLPKEHTESRADDLRNYKVVRRGDLVINRMSAYQGALGLSSLNGVTSPDYLVLRFRSGQYGPYWAYLMKSHWFVAEMTARVRGIGTVGNGTVRTPRISWDELKTIPIPLRTEEQQRAIADFLDCETAKIDALIEKLRDVQRRVDELRLSAIDHILSRTSGVPGTPLRGLVNIQTGLTLGKSYSDDEELLEYPYLRVANVQIGGFDLSDVATIRVPSSVAEAVMIQPGDILITEGGDRAALARGTIWRGQIENCLHQNHIYALRAKQSLLIPEFLVYVLESSTARTYFESTRRQTTNLSATNSKLVRAFRFTLPELSAQEAAVSEISQRLEALSQLSEKLSYSIALAQERRSALITAAVTGQGQVQWSGVAVPSSRR